MSSKTGKNTQVPEYFEFPNKILQLATIFSPVSIDSVAITKGF